MLKYNKDKIIYLINRGASMISTCQMIRGITPEVDRKRQRCRNGKIVIAFTVGCRVNNHSTVMEYHGELFVT